MSDQGELLTNQQTAALLGISPITLEIWRHRGKGPIFIKFGDRPQSPVRYKRAAVVQWVEGQSFSSTSAHSAAARTRTKSHSCPSSGASA